MGPQRDLSGVFTVLLFGVVWPPGCATDPGHDGECYSPYTRYVDPAALAEALSDDKLSKAECVSLCVDSTSEPTSSATTDTCHDTVTGGDESTDTGGSNTSGSSDTTGAAADTSSAAETCSEAGGVDEEHDSIDASSVHSCERYGETVDIISCNVVDCVAGRRPAGLRSEGRATGSGALGLWLAESAHFEAASAPAFERLAAALVEHGAQLELVRRALAAADDERRHADRMTTLAAEFGGAPVTPEIDAVPVPSLLELARDNAVEGCVGETWAALIARHQAQVAEFAQIRTVMAEIAVDETEHAELSWAIDAWLQTRLDPAERAEVLAARAAACAALREQLGRKPDRPALQNAGVPRRAAALALHDGLSRALWSSADPSTLSA